MPAPHAGYTTDEVVAKGREIYESRIKPLVEPAHKGDYVIIDVDTGDYEIDSDEMAASRRARAKRPDGARYGHRVGYSAAGTIGFTPRKLAR